MNIENMFDIEKLKNRISLNTNDRDNEIVIYGNYGYKVLNINELNDYELFMLVILAHNTILNDESIYCPITTKELIDYLKWDLVKVKSFIKSSNDIIIKPMFTEEGKLCGSGYVIKCLDNFLI